VRKGRPGFAMSFGLAFCSARLGGFPPLRVRPAGWLTTELGRKITVIAALDDVIAACLPGDGDLPGVPQVATPRWAREEIASIPALHEAYGRLIVVIDRDAGRTGARNPDAGHPNVNDALMRADRLRENAEAPRLPL
jgi:hypothetical protein